MLVRLLYASRPVDRSPAVLESILASARQHNPEQGVTGLLVYGDEVFLQVLEGGRASISDLFGAIQRDPRHKDVELLHFEEITQRRFGGWTMGLVDASRINTSVLLRYSLHPRLNPYAVSGQVSMALVEDLVASASIAGHL